MCSLSLFAFNSLSILLFPSAYFNASASCNVKLKFNYQLNDNCVWLKGLYQTDKLDDIMWSTISNVQFAFTQAWKVELLGLLINNHSVFAVVLHKSSYSRPVSSMDALTSSFDNAEAQTRTLRTAYVHIDNMPLISQLNSANLHVWNKTISSYRFWETRFQLTKIHLKYSRWLYSAFKNRRRKKTWF